MNTQKIKRAFIMLRYKKKARNLGLKFEVDKTTNDYIRILVLHSKEGIGHNSYRVIKQFLSVYKGYIKNGK